MEITTTSIEQAVEQARTDKTAIGKLYDFFFPKIFSYVSWRIGRETDAEDVVSDIFIKMVKNLSSYRAQKNGSFQSWLYCITRNTIIDYYRTHKNSITLDELPEIKTEDVTLEEQLDAQEMFVKIINLLNDLPARQAEIIRLKFIAELQNKEIAQILNIREKSVSAAVAKGLMFLKKRFETNNLSL
jgi:RNA polymerase sigma-70 factor (ECF subfamily)